MRAGNRFILLISNEDINDIIKIIKSLEDSGGLIAGVTEIVKNEIKKSDFLELSVVKGICGRGIRRAGILLIPSFKQYRDY